MTDEELNRIIMQSEDSYERLKDKVHEQYDEIERLKNVIDSDNDVIKNQDLEIEQLQSIIKEVREYIEKEYEENIIIVDYCDNPITPQDLYDDILEILENENKWKK